MKTRIERFCFGQFIFFLVLAVAALLSMSAPAGAIVYCLLCIISFFFMLLWAGLGVRTER